MATRKKCNTSTAPIKQDILSSMERILSACQQIERRNHDYSETYYKYNEAILESVKPDAEYLASQYHITPKQAVLFTIVLELAHNDDFSKSSIAKSLKSNFIRAISVDIDLYALEQALLIKKSYGDKFVIPEEVSACLAENRPFIKPDYSNLTTRAILSKIKRLLKTMEDIEGDRTIYLNQIDEMLLANPDTCIAKVANINHILIKGDQKVVLHDKERPASLDYCESMCPSERLLFYAMCYRYDDCDDDYCSWWDFKDYFDDKQMEYLENKYKMGQLDLQKWRVITYANRDGIKVKDHFKIRDSVKEEILADCGGLHENTPMTGTLKCDELVSKKLFYDDELSRQVKALSQLLSEERYGQIRTALKQKGMHTGFTCLFYGEPGTGKTETVYQLARSSGRNIIMADVSRLKSMWVGESEKNLKALFANYRKEVKDSKVTPILLFNEADAILGIRKIGADSAVDKMENSLQNIILQEMEDLQGIMIATTNLTDNLDKAFERRFLYKIKFTKPSNAIKSQIWKSMLPELDDIDASLLSKMFELSGGQIENIVRKKTIQSILTGSEAGLKEIIDYCNEEILDSSKGRKAIGF